MATSETASRSIRPGAVLDGRFRLVRELGRGGMGTVWEAEQLSLAAPCAIKLILEGVHHGSDILDRFEREARAVAALRSRHVVQVLDYGLWDGVPYLAMERLQGESLAQRLSRGRLSVSDTLAIARDVAPVLALAAQRGIVHRDLKPENIFIVDDGVERYAKVLDFGIAKLMDGRPLGTTVTGALMGTPWYMSPEQIQGAETVDPRCDLWALSVIVYECVTGTMPFDASSLGDLLRRIACATRPQPSAVVPALGTAFDAWWQRATDIDVDARFQTPAEWLCALEAASKDAAVAPAQTAPSSRAGRDSLAGQSWKRHARRKRSLVAVFYLALLGMCAGLLVHQRDALIPVLERGVAGAARESSSALTPPRHSAVRLPQPVRVAPSAVTSPRAPLPAPYVAPPTAEPIVREPPPILVPDDPQLPPADPGF